MKLVEVRGLTIAFGARRVVDDVSFSLDRGESLAIVGESGSGKSLTALSLLQLLPPGASCSGHVALDGHAMIGATQAKLRRARGEVAGMIFQEPMTSLNPLHRVGKQVGEAIALHKGLRGPKLRKRVISLLEECGFADAEHRLEAFPHQLSGGQRQRVMIAMALANDPKLLIADEPTTALDVTIQAQILALLARERQARGLALLLITHDLGVVRNCADRVCVMKDGTIVETGSVTQIFEQPQHPYTRMLLESEPRGRPAPVPPGAPEVMKVEDLRVHFPIRRGMLRRTVGHVRAVDGLSMRIRAGETVGLVGESGSGKSTTGFAMLRLEHCAGVIRFEDRDITDLNQRALRPLRSRAQIVFQDPFSSLSPRLPVGDIVAEGLRVHERLSRKECDARVLAALAEVGLPEEALHRFPHEFSGGQRQRIAIARAMVLNPKFVVLDEPTSALDRSVQSQIIDLLRKLQQRHQLGYLFISHDLAVVRALAHRVVVMRRGKVVERGDADQIFEHPQEDYTRALLAAAFGLDAPPEQLGLTAEEELDDG
jgi:microcin C transport system ATP-binding protein